VAERKVMALQRFIKRVVEAEIFDPIIQQAGLSPTRSEVRLNWGMPERPETKSEDIVKAVETGIITIDETRSMFKEMGWKITTPEEETPADKGMLT
jgi:hypothetical protein